MLKTMRSLRHRWLPQNYSSARYLEDTRSDTEMPEEEEEALPQMTTFATSFEVHRIMVLQLLFLCAAIGIASTNVHKWTWGAVKRIAFQWQPWAFSLAYSLWMLTAASFSMQFMTLYLKAKEIYTQTQINYIPDAISCVNLITIISSGITIDLIGRRWPVCLFVGLLLTVSLAILRSPNENVNLRLFGFILTGVYGCYTPILSGWANIACGKDPKLRAFSFSIMIAIGTAVGTPFQQYVFPSSQAPYYKQTDGFSYALAFTVLLTFWTGVGLPLLEFWKTKRQQFREIVHRLIKL